MSEKEQLFIPLMDIWDTINDIQTLRGVTTLVAYLTSPVHLKEDDDYGVFHDFLMDISTRLDSASENLEKARQNLVTIKGKGDC